MSNPLDAVACALFEAHRREWQGAWLEVPAEVRVHVPALIADWDDLAPLERRLWIAVAEETCVMIEPIAAIARRMRPRPNADFGRDVTQDDLLEALHAERSALITSREEVARLRRAVGSLRSAVRIALGEALIGQPALNTLREALRLTDVESPQPCSACLALDVQPVRPGRERLSRNATSGGRYSLILCDEHEADRKVAEE